MTGIPTRFGNFPAQWKAFWDATGKLWTPQTIAGKMFGTFVSTGTPGGGQELTALQSLSVAIHQGMVYVPIGYQISEITNLSEVHGGSPWGMNPFSSFRFVSFNWTWLMLISTNRSGYICWRRFSSAYGIRTYDREEARKTLRDVCQEPYSQLTSYGRTCGGGIF